MAQAWKTGAWKDGAWSANSWLGMATTLISGVLGRFLRLGRRRGMG